MDDNLLVQCRANTKKNVGLLLIITLGVVEFQHESEEGGSEAQVDCR